MVCKNNHIPGLILWALLWMVTPATSVMEVGRPMKKLNVTKLDCGIRLQAFAYAKQLVDDMGDMTLLDSVADALRLKSLCKVESTEQMSQPHTGTRPTDSSQTRQKKEPVDLCSSTSPCIFVTPRNQPYASSNRHRNITKKDSNTKHTLRQPRNGSKARPWSSIHDALQHARALLRSQEGKGPKVYPKIVLRDGIHSLFGKTLELSAQDSGLSVVGYPGENVWISGGLSLDEISFVEKNGTYVGNLTTLLHNHRPINVPKLVSLFTTDRRYTRARFPNADPETDQWGYASPLRLKYSIPAEKVLEWHRPPPAEVPDFTFFDFSNSPPPNVPYKNNSMQPGYNWYASGHGGACSDVWGDDADSYWCSNASQGGWSEVDQECATTGQMQLPIGMTYNTSSLDFPHLGGAILHAWHSQSWSMHMFEVSDHSEGEMKFIRGGGRQGGRNWCRCDQCTYAGHWCGQHQTPSWEDTRMISGTWMVENAIDLLDQPGEFFFDHNTMLMYVKPNSTADLQDFRLGLVEELVTIRNASNITIENVGFRDTAATYMADDWSAPSGGDWSLHRGAAVFLEDVTDVKIRNCHFRRLDGNAVFLSRRTRSVTIEYNEFKWLGENAIATWGETDDFDGTKENFPLNTIIQHNVMSELGIYQKQSSAVGQCKAAQTTIRNNIMFNTPRAAINFNDMLGGGDIVVGNLIFNSCRESGDHGPINTWDRQPFLTTLRDGQTRSFDPIPRTISHNFIFANYGASQGIDNDDGSSWHHIHHNVFYSAEGFKMDYGGHDSVFEDNLVMSYPYDGSQCFNMGGFLKGHGDTLRRNKCLLGLGDRMDSGCGDPSCAVPNSNSEDASKIIGTLWRGCKDSYVTLASNEYYTPDGTGFIRCGQTEKSLNSVQREFGLEADSTVSILPDEDVILQWTANMIKPQKLMTVLEH